MKGESAERVFCCVALGICLACAVPGASQQARDIEVPSQFTLDVDTAARVRPQMMAHSSAASERYATGTLVFERLTRQLPELSRSQFAWQVRIVDDDGLNAYSSPDGSVYVENGLARLAGTNAGLWSAILSHEIAHVARRDWARRYLYQKYLEKGASPAVILGDPSLPAVSWADSEKTSADIGRFSRELELEADREGLSLMAHAGYHPDFVPTLHHLLQARARKSTISPYAMHPCWEDRDHELSRAYVTTSIEFERRWPEWYASPGGNPPVVVFTERPTAKKTGSKEWQIQIVLRCQNLVGAVEVVLSTGSARERTAPMERLSDAPGADYEVRQLTGCTSPKTTVTFNLTDANAQKGYRASWMDIYVLDASGSVLARAEVPKLPR